MLFFVSAVGEVIFFFFFISPIYMALKEIRTGSPDKFSLAVRTMVG